MKNLSELTLTAKQLAEIAQWLSAQSVEARAKVTVRITETGIGPSLVALVEISDGSGIWRNFTEYDTW